MPVNSLEKTADSEYISNESLDAAMNDECSGEEHVGMDSNIQAPKSRHTPRSSRMSHLKLYRPSTGREVTLRFDEPEREVIRFPKFSRRAVGRSGMSILNRARILHENRTCPECEHCVVEPVELDDAVVNCNGMPIPGTATLVGFHCARCESEWPV